MESPASHILRQCFIDLDLGTIPQARSYWPISVSSMPNDGDQAIAIFDVQGRIDAKLMRTGEVIEHPGVMIHVRDIDFLRGADKVFALTTAMDQAIIRRQVTIDDSGTYLVQSVHRPTTSIFLGEEPERQRNLWSINARMSYTKIA